MAIPNEFNFLNVGLNPNLRILRDNLTVNLGVSVFYGMDIENSETDFFIYPNVTASYRVLDEAVIAYAGIEGGLVQNTYDEAVNLNPYVSPTLILAPTDKQYDGYLGFKGKISDLVSYNLRASYISEQNKPLFVHNRPEVIPLQGYDYGNSFSYRYDNLETLSAYAELNFEINRAFKLGINGEFFSYSTDNQIEAWNLPEVKASLFMDYQITEQWFAGAQAFFVGERMDIDSTVAATPGNPEPTVALDSYIDANINLGYRFNPQLSVFVKGNNLLGDNYEKWVDFPVQGIQFLGGVTYKFNY